MAPPSLPEELLIMICSCLCFHCGNSYDFPNADDPCVRESKVALARLCRTSKRMFAIGQPILYHYYASGNLPGPLYPMAANFLLADDKLPVFLGTIIRSPFLAAHIRSLQLFETNNLASFTPGLLYLIKGASKMIDIPIPIRQLQWSMNTSPQT